MDPFEASDRQQGTTDLGTGVQVPQGKQRQRRSSQIISRRLRCCPGRTLYSHNVLEVNLIYKPVNTTYIDETSETLD